MSRQYEAEKLSTAKQLIANNQLSINQIEQICQAFEYENNKLDFAKSAYNHCTEKGKYFQLMKIFQHESSKIELNEYITQQQQSEDNNQNEKNEKGNN